MYKVYRHFREDQILEVKTSTLGEALTHCSTCELTRDCGHAVSVRNDSGSIYEVNYYGSVEINVDGCATKEELALIKNHVMRDGLRWDCSLDKELLSSTANFYISESDCLLSFTFEKEYSLDEVLNDLEGFYFQWQHPEFEDEELADEIENETPDDWVVDHMYNTAEYKIKGVEIIEAYSSLIALSLEGLKVLKASLSDQIHSASSRAAEPHSTDKAPKKENTPER